MMQAAIVGDDVVLVVGGGERGGGGCRIAKNLNYKDGGGTGHQTCGCCLKTTQLGHVTLSM